MKIELSIKTDYLPKWGVFEGIRELVQNGRDAEIEFDAPLEVKHRSLTQKLVIENSNASLPHEALLFGHTTKTDKEELIGKFGEGLKLGSLALVRAGYEVKIRSGAEVWTPKIERSEKFNADVLVFYIEKGRKPRHRVQVEVSNVSKEEWDMMKPCFLFLNKAKDKLRMSTHYGALLLGKKHAGNIFVKGIFVERDPDIRFGYDLDRDVEIDRDRKMIARSDLNWRMRLIWQYSMEERNELVAEYMGALNENTGDVAGLDSYGASQLPEAVKEKVADNFKERHGDDAVPVSTVAEGKEVEHLGKKGVLTATRPLLAVLEETFGNVDQIKAALANEAMNFYGWSDLTLEEQVTLETAIALINGVEPFSLEEIDVVDFRSDDRGGIFKSGRVQIARKVLLDRDETLRVLVHELAHRVGSDGSWSHVNNMERLWSGIVSGLRSKSAN
jgi:hypothetical protein